MLILHYLKFLTMVELLLKRYLWLIDTLKTNGEMTFDEIAERWETSSLNDNGSVLTKGTFCNHCQAVARHFIQELLLHRDQMEVLSPQSLRDELNEIITKMKNR